MAERLWYDVQAPENELILVSGSFTGNGTGAATGIEGILESVTRTGVGAFDLVLKHEFPALLFPGDPVVVGPTGLRGVIESIDVSAGTLSIQLDVAGTDTDPTTDDEVFIGLWVRNSSLKER